jgi:hypothetical protein
MKTRNALILTVVLIAAALAPNALAKRFDDAYVSNPNKVGVQQAPSIRPDDRAGLRGASQSEAVPTASRPDDRAGLHGPGTFTPTVVEATSTGFDWGDALIGGIGGIGTALALMGAFFLVASRRSRARMA